jgi:hypothetical protein
VQRRKVGAWGKGRGSPSYIVNTVLPSPHHSELLVKLKGGRPGKVTVNREDC